MTDHSQTAVDGFTRGLGPQVWEEYQEATEANYAPGEFVTLHAYEASFRAPFDHHNVFFRGAPSPLLAPQTMTLPELWAQPEAGQALTIPHHTGKFPAPLTTDAHDPERRRNFEIYSAHGLSESYDPTHPLAFEQSDFTNYSTSAPDGLTAQDMWAQGLVLSTIAASDDHRSHPGQPHWGVAAVRAPELTREAIFDALYARRTYETTGARILLDFTVDGAPMGSETPAAGPPRLHVEAHGTERHRVRAGPPLLDGRGRLLGPLRPAAGRPRLRGRASTAGSAATPSTTCACASAATSGAGWSWRGPARSG